MDTVTAEKRSWIMGRIRGKDTKPEMVVRRLAHSLGYRYRLHRRSLPGSPDLVFPSRRKVIFVNGCFWHAHRCLGGKLPKSRTEFWREKLEGNKARDARNRLELRRSGWGVMTVWECEMKDAERLAERIRGFLA